MEKIDVVAFEKMANALMEILNKIIATLTWFINGWKSKDAFDENSAVNE